LDSGECGGDLYDSLITTDSAGPHRADSRAKSPSGGEKRIIARTARKVAPFLSYAHTQIDFFYSSVCPLAREEFLRELLAFVGSICPANANFDLSFSVTFE